MASRRNTVPVLLASALILAACGGDGGSDCGNAAGDPVVDGALVTAVAGDPGNLDPHMTVLALTRYVGSYLYDQLVFIDEEGQPRPWLAESWQEEPGSVTFTLKEDITCSDGAPLTASDVAAGVEREPRELDLVPVRDNLFAVRLPGLRTWTPVTFYRLADGSPYVHMGARATRKVGS